MNREELEAYIQNHYATHIVDRADSFAFSRIDMTPKKAIVFVNEHYVISVSFKCQI